MRAVGAPPLPAPATRSLGRGERASRLRLRPHPPALSQASSFTVTVGGGPGWDGPPPRGGATPATTSICAVVVLVVPNDEVDGRVGADVVDVQAESRSAVESVPAVPSLIIEVMFSRSAVAIRSRTNRTRCPLGTVCRCSASGGRAAQTRSVRLPLPERR